MKRITLRVGESFRTPSGRQVRYLQPSRGGQALVEDTHSGVIEALPAESLNEDRDVPDFRLPEILELPPERQKIVVERCRVFGELLHRQKRGRQLVARAAAALGVSVATAYRLLRDYDRMGPAFAFAPRKRGPAQGGSQILAETEAFMMKEIHSYHLSPKRPRASQTIASIHLGCRENGLPPPSASTVRRRIRRERPIKVLRAREGAAAARKLESLRGKFEGSAYPLGLVEIDHTLLDIVLVDDVHRLPLGRPWVTMAIDVNSRVEPGHFISFDRPSATSVGLCLAHCILDKQEYLTKHGLKSPWPVWGVPDRIHCDNGQEFHSLALQSACAQLGMDIDYRPPGRPQFGAHIERLLGNTLGHIHVCPGTTFSSPEERGSYPSEELAAMTLSEFERWFAIQVVEIYHNTTHRELGISPLEMWERGIVGHGNQPGRGLIDRIADRKNLLLLFLPAEYRTVQRYGISWDDLIYYHPCLSPWTLAPDPKNPKEHRKFLVRRDPRDLSVIHFLDPESETYFAIPRLSSDAPAVNLWELRQARRRLRERGVKEINEARLMEGMAEQRALEDRAVLESKRARLGVARRARAEALASKRLAGAPSTALMLPEAPPEANDVEMSDPVVPFRHE